LEQSEFVDDDYNVTYLASNNGDYAMKVDSYEKTEEMNVGGIQIGRFAAHAAQLCALDDSKKAGN